MEFFKGLSEPTGVKYFQNEILVSTSKFCICTARQSLLPALSLYSEEQSLEDEEKIWVEE